MTREAARSNPLATRRVSAEWRITAEECPYPYPNSYWYGGRTWTWMCPPSSSLPHRRGNGLEFRKMIQWPDVLKLANNGNPAPARKVVKTEAEWRRQLTDQQYQITRQSATERAFGSEMCSLFEPGIYSCLCCDQLLFDSNEKFESHTGWPSFTQPIQADAIAYRFDGPAFLKRVETICNTCGAHLGHVFPDGPEPSGLRYCMNAVALKKAAKS